MPWWMLRGWLTGVLFRITCTQPRETEIQAKLMFTFMGYCCFLLQQSQEISARSGGCGSAVPSPSSQRCWMVILAPLEAMTEQNSISLTRTENLLECLILYRYLDMIQPWHAKVKATVHLFRCQSKKKRFILTCNSILWEENTSVHAELWFQVTWTKEDDSYKMRQLSWRTQQGCIGWELKSSPTLQKSLIVPLTLCGNVWSCREDHSFSIVPFILRN